MILSEIAPPLIVGYRDRLKQEIIVREKGGNGNGKVKSKATVNRMMATLSGVLTYCMKEKFWINSNPCSSVSSLKKPGKTGPPKKPSNHWSNVLEPCGG